MSVLKPGYMLSVGVHVVLITAAFVMRQPPPHVFKQVAVYIPPPKHKAAKEKPPEQQVEEKKKPPPPPPPQRKLAKAAPEPAKAAEPAPAPVHQALNALPDFGISLSGGDMGAGVGIAVPNAVNPIGAGDAPSSTKGRAQAPKEKVLHAANTNGDSNAGADDNDEATKPIPDKGSFVQPQFTDDARSANVEGKVKLRLTVDAQGNVVKVEVLSGLGHGLDESSIAAAKRMHFTPSMLHGKPQTATFVLSIRFVLGE